MKYTKRCLETQGWSELNKPATAAVQVLLKTSHLLKLHCFFISFGYIKTVKRRFRSKLQLLVESTHKAAWIGDLVVLLLYLANKNRATLLISKNLSLAHSSSY